ncbi:MAG TPA: hypothetical protein VGB44_03085 [Flavobacterium sp.]|jgi:hypothetical protein
MKKFFLLLMLCLHSAFGFGQRTYEFDYILEYQHRHEDTGELHTYFYLTNSLDNSYILSIHDLPNNVYSLRFTHLDGSHGSATISKSDFFKAESMTMNCDNFHHHKNDETWRNQYKIDNPGDTIINAISHKRYCYKPANPKKEKRRRLSTTTFIIEPGTEFHLPILHNVRAFNEWKAGAPIPSGIVKQSYYKKPKQKGMIRVNTLISYTKIKKFIVVPAECYDRTPIKPKVISSYRK